MEIFAEMLFNGESRVEVEVQVPRRKPPLGGLAGLPPQKWASLLALLSILAPSLAWAATSSAALPMDPSKYTLASAGAFISWIFTRSGYSNRLIIDDRSEEHTSELQSRFD